MVCDCVLCPPHDMSLLSLERLSVPWFQSMLYGYTICNAVKRDVGFFLWFVRGFRPLLWTCQHFKSHLYNSGTSSVLFSVIAPSLLIQQKTWHSGSRAFLWVLQTWGWSVWCVRVSWLFSSSHPTLVQVSSRAGLTQCATGRATVVELSALSYIMATNISVCSQNILWININTLVDEIM